MNVYVASNGDPVTTTAAAWDSTANTTNSSAVPSGLTNGTNAVWIGIQGDINSEFDNARFTCGSASINTIAAVRTALNNQANWTRTNDTPVGFTLPTGCSYLTVTAANVAVSGRVTTAEGRGIFKASVTLTDNGGNVLYALTNDFGYYRFEEVQAGTTCVLNVASKRFQFAQPTQVISVNEELTRMDFVALAQKVGNSVIF